PLRVDRRSGPLRVGRRPLRVARRPLRVARRPRPLRVDRRSGPPGRGPRMDTFRRNGATVTFPGLATMAGSPAFRAGRVYLGWQYGLAHPDPGPPPRRPVPAEQEQLNPGWLAAQRREERLLTRYWKVSAGVCLAATALVLVLGTVGPLNPALTALGAAVFV